MEQFAPDEQFARLKAVLGPYGGHFGLYTAGDNRGALFDQIGAEMYAVARPGVEWRKK